jgi:exopolysaccharide biosynthesis polyprenyl glycosylphosphotransferase
MQNDADFSRIVIGISFFSVSFFVLLERYILFRVEWNMARHSNQKSNIMILGTDNVALHVTHTLHNEPMLRTRVIGFLKTSDNAAHPDLQKELILGDLNDLQRLIKEKQIDEIILTDSRIDHDRVVKILLLCEHSLVTFKMVPDLFRIMTTSMDVQSLDDIPLLGISTWPLDKFWNRLMKRVEDVTGAIVGLLISAPIITIAAILIKRTSPGPIFYSQERCGENGKTFTIYKLRTMHTDAEEKSGPVWTTENDSRRTAIGSFLRRCNLDELPQFWNVLIGDMSLVGPRPERPHFVEQFKEDIGRYMWRHVSKPGLTGWAQVNGLRGNTDLNERIKYDLFYLENWSLAFDFKILVKTLFASKNAY